MYEHKNAPPEMNSDHYGQEYLQNGRDFLFEV